MKIAKIIIHHSLSPDSPEVDWDAIRRYHVEVNGWDDIGYHWGIERVGDGYVVQTGRPETMVGAHTQGMNHKSIGICMVGNFDRQAPSEAALILLAELCARKCRAYGLRPEDIEPHRKYALYKTCPGVKFPMEGLRQKVKERLEGDKR